uniref:Uncharacterized protein n=1 Tax=Romanomermis culicivorax TaxID=13658 RepID=A0A915I8X4_ROMCU
MKCSGIRFRCLQLHLMPDLKKEGKQLLDNSAMDTSRKSEQYPDDYAAKTYSEKCRDTQKQITDRYLIDRQK